MNWKLLIFKVIIWSYRWRKKTPLTIEEEIDNHNCAHYFYFKTCSILLMCRKVGKKALCSEENCPLKKKVKDDLEN